MIGIYPTERMPREFAIDPSGRYLYVAGEASGKLAINLINPDTGELSLKEILDVGKQPTWGWLRRPTRQQR